MEREAHRALVQAELAEAQALGVGVHAVGPLEGRDDQLGLVDDAQAAASLRAGVVVTGTADFRLPIS